MINVVYLVLVFSSGLGSVSIPQANINQCKINSSEYIKEDKVLRAYCIVGVK